MKIILNVGGMKMEFLKIQITFDFLTSVVNYVLGFHWMTLHLET